MRISVTSKDPASAAGDYLVLIHEKGKAYCSIGAPTASKEFARFGRAADSGKMKRMDVVPSWSTAKADRMLMIGMLSGARKHWPRSEQIRGVAAEVYKHCKSGNARKVVFLLNGEAGAEIAGQIAEGLTVSGYDFDDYKKEADEFSQKFAAELVVDSSALKETRESVSKAVALCESVNACRDLINHPGSVATPEMVADRAVEMATEMGLQCEVLTEAMLEEQGYNGLIAVGKGSNHPPRMVIFRHRPEAAGDTHLALLGKGVTFDTGGLCLKPGREMWEMICDMSGAAAVFGAMRAIGQMKPNVAVTGIMVLAENDIGREATLPGDIFKAKNGKSIHVLNTDAEGRLILSDGLARAGEEGATHIVDIATLTGSCVRALGDSLSGLFCDDDDMVDSLMDLAEVEGERMWRLPIYSEYRGHLEHYRTDVNNVGSTPNGGAIHAALFLKEFVPENTTWAHIDIAGTALATKGYRYLGAGGRGTMVRTLFRLAHKLGAIED